MQIGVTVIFHIHCATKLLAKGFGFGPVWSMLKWTKSETTFIDLEVNPLKHRKSRLRNDFLSIFF